ALALATMPSAKWMAYLTPTLDIFGQRVLRYQIGGAGDDHAFWKKNLPDDVENIETALASLVPGPSVSLPWPPARELPPLARRGGEATPQVAKPTSTTQPPPPGPATGPGGAPTPQTLRALSTPSPARQSGVLVDAFTLWYPLGFPSD